MRGESEEATAPEMQGFFIASVSRAKNIDEDE
jgi:hypothetical protein